ncbi:hypothetical protein [Yersinia enterocolitica]|uniref:hypothetical protein n=2 Tax=Yersinia enterocolitica TaxID=630 RepID=UPI003D015A03
MLMKELNSFTVERLEELARAKMISGYDIADIRALAAIVLAAKMAEPIYQYHTGIINEEGDIDWYWVDCDKGFYSQYDNQHRRIVYTTPQLNSPEIPDGWKLVPIEPTLAMLTLLGLTGSFESMLERYANMLDAAPERENG